MVIRLKSRHADYEVFKKLLNITKLDNAMPIHKKESDRTKKYTSNAVIFLNGELLEYSRRKARIWKI